MSETLFWKVVAILCLWIGVAAMQTVLGRNDHKAWPISAWRTFAAWLVISAVPLGTFGGWWLTSSNAPPLIIVLLFATGLWLAGWKWGASLPIIGRWVKVLQAREIERADKGIL
ncbi:MAG: hypothetical protein ACOY4K_13250 [Pseudomonadota bacterium]